MRIFSWPIFAALCLTVVGASMLLLVAGQNNSGRRDFIEYWSIGHQLLRGQNPYDEVAVLPLQRQAGLHADYPLVSISPPIAFFLVLPLGAVDANIGLVAWLIILLASVFASIRMLWNMRGRPDNRLHLLGYCFAPIMSCLMLGQLGIFLLLGITIFLYCHKSRPFIAGAVLLPCALKPHLFVPFAIVLLIWIIIRKGYLILAGFSASLIASCSLTL
jgi:hypothetical protein